MERNVNKYYIQVQADELNGASMVSIRQPQVQQ